MQPHRLERPHVDFLRSLALADHAHVHAGSRLCLEQLDEQRVLEVDVVDQDLALRTFDEGGQHLARVFRTDDQMRPLGNVWLPAAVGFEQRARFADGARVPRRYAEAAALERIDLGEIEAEQVQHVVGDHELVVVAREVVARAGHCRAGLEQTLFELTQTSLATAVGVRHEHAHLDAALDCRAERLLDFRLIEAEDRDVNRALRLLDGAHHRCQAGFGLDDQIHWSSSSASGRAFFSSFHSICALPSGASALSAADRRSVFSDSPAFTR